MMQPSGFSSDFGDGFAISPTGAETGDLQFNLAVEDSSFTTTVDTRSSTIAYFCFTIEDNFGPVDALVLGINDIFEDIEDVFEAGVRDLNCPDGIPPEITTVFLGEISEGPVTVTIDTFASQFDTEVALWNEGGTLLAQDDQGGPFGTSVIAEFPLTEGVYVAGGSEFNVIFGDNFQIGGNGLEDGDVFDYIITITDSGGNSIPETVTISAIDSTRSIFIGGAGETEDTAKFESVLFCFSVGPAFTAGDVVDGFIDTSDEVVDSFFGGILGLISNVLASILGGFGF